MKIPKDWTFHSKEVARGFNRHVREQLPWYELTTSMVAHIARHYIQQDGLVYDIGASTGNIGIAINETIRLRNATLVSIDSSQEMLKKYRGPGVLTIADAGKFEFKRYDFAVCFLVLMFIPPSTRGNLIGKLRSLIKPGGALVVFDKCIPVGGYASAVMLRLALSEKLKSGARPEEIIAKELSIAGSQRPIDPGELGVDAIEVFRFGDFAGWIIEKPTH